MEQLKTNNEEMKKLIQDICFQIEDKIKSSTQTHIPTTELSLLNDEFIPLHQTITRYKDSITQLKAKLEGFYNLRRIVSMEQEVKVKKEQLYSVKYENNVLCNIQKTQSKAIIQYQNKYENKNEINTLTEKLRVLKEEYKYSREMQRSTEIKLKTQNAAIVALEEKCKVIRENIEYKKKKMENQEGNKVNVTILPLTMNSLMKMKLVV